MNYLNWLHSQHQLNEKDTILDIGCGDARFLRMLKIELRNFILFKPIIKFYNYKF